jgi:hypothetical protein
MPGCVELIDRTCEHVFVGDHGTPGGRLKRALRTGDPLTAMSAAADVNRLVVDDALALAILLLRADDARGSRAAARALGRYVLELTRVDLDELALLVDGFERVTRGEREPYGLQIAFDARRLRAAREQLDR